MVEKMINFDNLHALIKKETMIALQETMGSLMDTSDQGHEERRRQEQQAKAVDGRNLSKGVKEEVDEADEDNEEKPAEPEKREDRTGGKGTKDSQKLKTPSKKGLKSATVGCVVDKLNALRGGRSLKDPDVQKSFKQYFGALTTQERQSLLVFLTGIAQILAGTKQGTEAIDPGDVGLRIKGKTPGAKEKIDEPKKDSKTGTQPIVVGETVKRSIKAAIKAYKKNAI